MSGFQSTCESQMQRLNRYSDSDVEENGDVDGEEQCFLTFSESHSSLRV